MVSFYVEGLVFFKADDSKTFFLYNIVGKLTVGRRPEKRLFATVENAMTVIFLFIFTYSIEI